MYKYNYYFDIGFTEYLLHKSYLIPKIKSKPASLNITWVRSEFECILNAKFETRTTKILSSLFLHSNSTKRDPYKELRSRIHQYLF